MKIAKLSILAAFFLQGMFCSQTAFAQAQEVISKAAPDAKVYFIQPKDGDVISQESVVKFGLSGMGIAPAGVLFANSGHHHLLINLDTLPDMTTSLPANDNIIHFGKGQTEATIKLAPGKHKLKLLMGNYLHIPHEKPVISEEITVTVK
jgi:Domain of unknown function (DUF4399)